MIFIELRFLVFFAIVFAVHWGLASNRRRKLWLLLASYAFYAGWDWRFLSLIWTSTLVDYVVARHLGRTRHRHRRNALLAISVAVNLGLLGVFKYFNFFTESGAEFLRLLGLSVSHPTLAVVLPVGISFYTFQTLSYTIDVYRGKLRPTRDLLDVALFVAFFPQLVAGPIVRAGWFLPQLRIARRFKEVDVRWCLVLFLAGFVKKACIGDNLGVVVDSYFAAPTQFDALSAWIATVGYAVQIYCDFSGYSDMAIACAGLLGYRLRLNFAFPYFAGSIRAFWQRWHISLSTWLRDYLYIPLGGNRGSRWATSRNLMLTMLLGGLWHGAAWNFVIWGGLHGLALLFHRACKERVDPGSTLGRLVSKLGGPVTLYWVLLTWVFFRAADLGDSVAIARAFVLLQDLGSQRLEVGALWAVAAFVVVHLAAYRGWLERAWLEAPGWAFSTAYGIAVAVSLMFLHVGAEPFIYFQF